MDLFHQLVDSLTARIVESDYLTGNGLLGDICWTVASINATHQICLSDIENVLVTVWETLPDSVEPLWISRAFVEGKLVLRFLKQSEIVDYAAINSGIKVEVVLWGLCLSKYSTDFIVSNFKFTNEASGQHEEQHIDTEMTVGDVLAIVDQKKAVLRQTEGSSPVTPLKHVAHSLVTFLLPEGELALNDSHSSVVGASSAAPRRDERQPTIREFLNHETERRKYDGKVMAATVRKGRHISLKHFMSHKDGA